MEGPGDIAERPATEPLTRRKLAVGGFQVHATAFLITTGMASLAWLVLTLLGRGPGFFFPIIPLAVWLPFLALHAWSVFRTYPDDADEPVRVPLVFDQPELEE